VVALLTDAGEMVEWVKHSAYGVPFALPAGDTDSDGDWDATDSTTILGGGAYDVRKDADLDGDVDAADATQAHSITGSYQTLGRGVLSSAAVSNRRGYAGYEYAPEFQGAGRHIYHVRHRVYDAGVGRWTRRDPLGYVDGMSLYEYVGSQPVTARDPRGLFVCVGLCRRPASGPIPTPSGSGVPLECPSVGGDSAGGGGQPSPPAAPRAPGSPPGVFDWRDCPGFGGCSGGVKPKPDRMPRERWMRSSPPTHFVASSLSALETPLMPFPSGTRQAWWASSLSTSRFRAPAMSPRTPRT